MDTLVKFCAPEHNIANGCNTIQFGTLEYYREYEDPNSPIADLDEGIDTMDVVSFQSDNASKEAREALRRIIPTDYPGIILDHYQLEEEVPNCFIWCCSKSSNPISLKQGTSMDPNYISYFEIADGLRFGKQLKELLWACVLGRFISSTPKDVIPGISLSQRREEVRLSMIHTDVIYVEKKKAEIIEGELHPYPEDFPSVEHRPFFVKAKKFEEQREYRYLFCFVNKQNNHILPVQKEPLILPINPVSRHLINETLGESR